MKRPIRILAMLAAIAFLECSVPAVAQQPVLGTEAQREAGKGLYGKYCSQCHGEAGDGQGYATPYLQPLPRDFTSGLFKIRSTPNGAMPTDEDLRKVIREGMPYTTMIGWPDFSNEEVENIIYHLKTFSPDFGDPDYLDPPINIPATPAFTQDSADLGRVVYGNMECHTCHGATGRTDGASAPTLLDEAGHSIRPADLTKRWTFRGGTTREDIYRTFSTGLNGTPMPSYIDSLTNEERWQLVDFVYSLGDSDTPEYSDRLIAVSIAEDIDIAKGEALFASAQSAYFPLIGQIIEPGRAFHPAASGIEVKAIHNGREVAFLVKWNDMQADVSGSNSPALETPPFEPPAEAEQDDPAPTETEEPVLGVDDFFGVTAEPAEPQTQDVDDFFGVAAEPTEPQTQDVDDFFGVAAEPAEPPAQDVDDFFGVAAGEETAQDDFFTAQPVTEPVGDTVGKSAFSDAVAIQFPSAAPKGLSLPYFIFGDLKSSVDIWFADLAKERAERFIGRGSASVTLNDLDGLEMRATYEGGTWSVIFKQKRQSDAGISFEEEQWMPMAFSVWDGLSEERGNQRALTSWFYVYIEPAESVSPLFPMGKTALTVLAIEIALIALIRKKHGKNVLTLQTTT